MFAKMTSRRNKTATWLIVTTTLGALAGPLGSAPAANAATTSCLKITVAQVSLAMGVKATAASSISRGKVTMCMYTVGGDTSAVTFQVVSSSTLATFKAGMKLAKTVGESPKTDSKFAPYPAFSTAMKSAAYHYTTVGVTVLKGSKQIQVVANYSLSKVESLTRVLLTKL